jgi:hypothetical protein
MILSKIRPLEVIQSFTPVMDIGTGSLNKIRKTQRYRQKPEMGLMARGRLEQIPLISFADAGNTYMVLTAAPVARANGNPKITI